MSDSTMQPAAGGTTGQQRSFIDECWTYAAPHISGQHGAAVPQTIDAAGLLPRDPDLPQTGWGHKSGCRKTSCELLLRESVENDPGRLAAFKAGAEIAPTAPDDLDPDARERFEERAAIMEYDGGLSRGSAEQLAFEDIAGRGADPAAWTRR